LEKKRGKRPEIDGEELEGEESSVEKERTLECYTYLPY